MGLQERLYDLKDEMEQARNNVPVMVKTIVGDGLDNIFESLESFVDVVIDMAIELEAE